MGLAQCRRFRQTPRRRPVSELSQHGIVGDHAEQADAAPESSSSAAATGTEAPLGVFFAALGAALILLLENQLLISWFVPREAGLGARFAYRAYDAGYFCALGVLYAGATLAGAKLLDLAPIARLKPVLRPLSILTAWFLVVLMLGADDLDNYVARVGLDPGFALITASVVAGAAFAGAVELLRLAKARVLKALIAAGALALVVSNSLLLEQDYPALHLLAAGASATALTLVLADLPFSRQARRAAYVALPLIAGAGLVAVLRAPSLTTLRQLYSLPSSVVVPFLPNEWKDDPVLGPLPEWVVKSPWFAERERLPPRAPTGALALPDDPIVILLTIDALRADIVTGGEYREKLPELARLRKTSVYFRNARSPTPSTLTTVASMFTGKYYSALYWTKSKHGKVLPIEDESPTVAELIQPIPSVQVLSLYGLASESGVGRGFKEEIKTRRDYGYARDLMARLIERLERKNQGPLFVYAHFIDTHAPYTRGGREGSPRERYIAEVATVDRELGRLRRFLDAKGLSRRVVLIVSADHGEAFGEHGMRYHARSVYEELLHIPLMLQIPGAGARDVDVPVTLLDLGPTLLDMFDEPTPAHFMGESLLPLAAGHDEELTRPIAADAGRRIQAFYAPEHKKVIFDLRRKTTEVYDLARDPKESRNLVDERNESVVSAVTAARYFFQVHTLTRPGWEPPWRKF